MRGDSSGKVTKPATVDTGATLQVCALPLQHRLSVRAAPACG